MPDKNALPAGQSPFAQRAQRAPLNTLAPPTAQPAQPTPGGDSQAGQTMAAFNINLGEWQGRIKNAHKRAELEGIIGELNGLKSQIKAQMNPTVNQGGPVIKAPGTAQPSPFARQEAAPVVPPKGRM